MSRTVVVLGAHSAVGESVVTCLGERDLGAEVVAATTTSHVAQDSVLIDAALVARGDLFLLAFDDDIATGLAAGLRQQKKPLVDLAGVVSDAALVFPTLDAHSAAPLVDGEAVRLSTGLAEPVAAVLRALKPFSVRRASVVTYESAAVFDRPGMDELSEQTRAVFTMQGRPAERFAATLAFDTIPTVTGPDGDWAAADAALADAIRAAEPGVPVFATRALVPSFSSDAAVLTFDVEGTPDRETVELALKGGRGMHYTADAPPPSVDAVGRDDALVGRLVVDAGRITCWLVADRLRRGSATQAALLVERWLDIENGASVERP